MSTIVNQKPMELSTNQLAQLHRTQLRIAVELKRVCDTHGLEYFLMAGTLLGAIRHKGFIPWDDDMDIGMPRDSYEKFLTLGQTEMGPEYFLQTMDSDPGYGLSFAKIRLKNTELVEISSAKTTAHNGIFIDVFPLDNVPPEIWKRHIHAYLTSAIKRAVLLRQGYEPWFASSRLKSLVHQSATPLARLLPISILSSALNTCMQWFNSKPTEYMTAIGGSYGYRKESIDRRWIGSLPERDFEGTSFRCLAGASDYLANLYGDYMTPPAVEGQRSRHGIIKLKFNADSCN